MVRVIDICPRCGEYGSKYVAKVKGIPYLYFIHREGGRVVRRCYIGRAGAQGGLGAWGLGAPHHPWNLPPPSAATRAPARGPHSSLATRAPQRGPLWGAERLGAVERPRGEAGGGAVELLLFEKLARSLSRREEKRVEVFDDELRKLIDEYVRVKSRVEEKILALSIFLVSLPLLMVFFPSGIPILVEKFERIMSGSGNA